MRDARLQRLERATGGLDPPFAIVDLDALELNAADMERRAGTKPIRLASKSVRCRALQERILGRPGFSGTLAFTLPEALWLAAAGFDDLLVAYPTADRRALRSLAQLQAERPQAQVTLTVDSVEQLDLIEAALDCQPGSAGTAVDELGAPVPGGPVEEGSEAGLLEPPPTVSSEVASRRGRVRLCIDLDAGLWLLGGRMRIGVKRSPVHTPADAAELAHRIVERERFELVGMMAYEAQIAGLGDAPPKRRLRAAAIRALQARSIRELAPRRAAAAQAVEGVLAAHGARLQLVNGGGTGSLHLGAPAQEVSELSAGSGLYGPTLFDAYRAFCPEPAMLFALPVVRRPAATVVTVLGGGYLASGPGDRARLPSPHLPAGLRLDRQEGAGEVQTPLIGLPAASLGVGDRVWLRHAKAGELCERFDRLHLIEGGRVVDVVPTYRGEGRCFL